MTWLPQNVISASYKRWKSNNNTHSYQQIVLHHNPHHCLELLYPNSVSDSSLHQSHCCLNHRSHCCDWTNWRPMQRCTKQARSSSCAISFVIMICLYVEKSFKYWISDLRPMGSNTSSTKWRKIACMQNQYEIRVIHCTSRGYTRTDTNAITPGVTSFIPQRWPAVPVDGALVAESDEPPNKIERSIYKC